MSDIFTKEKRSWVMSKIKSKWTKQEVMAHNYLKGKRIKYKMHPKMEGNPDIIIPDKKVAIFLHGCFWHKCPLHYRPPKSRRKYWLPKIEKNALRDNNNIKLLKKSGWKVVVIWEHDIKKMEMRISKLLKIA
jgi:DNA mismatch endonuclease (patch repair protein)